MKNRIGRELGPGSKVLLAIAGLVAVAGPLAVGIMDAPVLRGQSGTVASPKYEVATIRPAKDDGEVGFDTEKGRFLAHNVTIKRLVARAYNLDIKLISGGPKWVDSDRYDIDAKFPDGLAQPTSEQGQLMLQDLLADRFQLVIHRESQPNLRICPGGRKEWPENGARRPGSERHKDAFFEEWAS